MVALIIEDGTGKPDANSYASLVDARSFAESRGITLSNDDNVLSVQLIQSADFLNTFESKFKGDRSFPGNPQALSFPRDCVNTFGFDNPKAYIPTSILVGAQVSIVQAIASGINLFPTQSGPNVTRETIGPITTEYQENSWTDSTLPIVSAAEKILQPLFRDGGGFWQTVRA